MARARGRGRMRFRARPPPSLRTAMQELGLSATTHYQNAVSDALGASVDAARAYYPQLREGSASRAQAPTDAERALLTRLSSLDKALRLAPAYRIAKQASGTSHAGLCAELRQTASYFASITSNETANPALWHSDAAWLIPELLPAELRPARLKRGGIQHVKQGTRVAALPNLVADDHQERAEDDEVPEELVEIEEEDEDPDLHADYTAAAHFDDDDGYEEVDSGRDEAVI